MVLGINLSSAFRLEKLIRFWIIYFKINQTKSIISTLAISLTWIFSSSAPLNKANYQQNQDQESDGTHQSNKPALSCNVPLILSVGYLKELKKEKINRIEPIHTVVINYQARVIWSSPIDSQCSYFGSDVLDNHAPPVCVTGMCMSVCAKFYFVYNCTTSLCLATIV